MHYRVIRDLGNTDLPVGSLFDGQALDARRLQRLLEQGRVAPAPEPGGEAERLAFLEADVVALKAENARLEAALAEVQAGGSDDQGSEGQEPDPEATDRAKELQNHTVPELKDLAAARGITGVSSMTKPELIAALVAHAEGPAEAPEA